MNDLVRTQQQLTAARERRAAVEVELADALAEERTLLAELLPAQIKATLHAHPELESFAFSIRTSEFDDQGPSEGVVLHAAKFDDGQHITTLSQLDWNFIPDEHPSKQLTPSRLKLCRDLQDVLAPCDADLVCEVFGMSVGDEYAMVICDRTGAAITGYYDYA